MRGVLEISWLISTISWGPPDTEARRLSLLETLGVLGGRHCIEDPGVNQTDWVSQDAYVGKPHSYEVCRPAVSPEPFKMKSALTFINDIHDLITVKTRGGNEAAIWNETYLGTLTSAIWAKAKTQVTH